MPNEGEEKPLLSAVEDLKRPAALSLSGRRVEEATLCGLWNCQSVGRQAGPAHIIRFERSQLQSQPTDTPDSPTPSGPE